ncbi:hypothetical protein PUN28_018930 [Cardiocondyla obscurior]|uniref:WW domain-containing protein n=1 Tax=Cardiocondyla obscurior TaxID=286306 RepID=A0AAW2EGP3_9HYME
MLKQQLPKDWIELNSKTHPDRVYYFNVKTKKSSWSVPTLDITNKTSEVKRRATNKRWNYNDMTKVVHNDEKEQKHTTQQVSKKSSVKVQVKHRQDRKNKSLSPPPETIKNTKQITSPNHSSNLRDNISVTSRHKECVALTPQMKLLLQKKLESVPKALSFNKKNSKEDGNIKGRQEKLPLKKNLAKERMQRLKKNLAIDNEKLKEMYCANLVDVKTSQKSLSSASTLSDNESLDSTFTCKNTERLKKLHNKILKNAVYEKKIALNEELPNQQNTECTENMTTSKLLELAKKEVFYEEMDWEPMKDEEIALEVPSV